MPEVLAGKSSFAGLDALSAARDLYPIDRAS
jgi:hypothetical protein